MVDFGGLEIFPFCALNPFKPTQLLAFSDSLGVFGMVIFGRFFHRQITDSPTDSGFAGFWGVFKTGHFFLIFGMVIFFYLAHSPQTSLFYIYIEETHSAFFHRQNTDRAPIATDRGKNFGRFWVESRSILWVNPFSFFGDRGGNPPPLILVAATPTPYPPILSGGGDLGRV